MGGSLRGPVAVPGTYQARLEVGRPGLDAARSRSGRIRGSRRPPRISRRSSICSCGIRDRLSEVHQTIGDGRRSARSSCRGSRHAHAAGHELADVARQARGAFEEAPGRSRRLYEPRFIGVDDQLLLFPLKLNARLASLGGVVSSADRAPTSAAHDVFRDLSAQLDAELAKLQRMVSSELPALNRSAQEKGMDLVSVRATIRTGSLGSRR